MLRKIFILLLLLISFLYSQEDQQLPVDIPLIKAVADNDINELKSLIKELIL